MKVLFLAGKIPYPAVDGGTLATYHALKGLYEAGVEVTFFSLNTLKHYSDPKLIQERFPRMRIFQFDADLSVKPFDAFMNLFTDDSYNIIRFYKRKVNRALEKLLGEEQFDVVHIDSLFMVPYLKTIRAFSKAKVVLRSHNIEHHIWKNLADNTTQPLKKAYLNLLTRRLQDYEIKHLNAFDHILAISSADADEMKRLGCIIPVTVHHSGFDFSLVNKYLNIEPAHNFFYIGSMNWMPNVEGVQWLLQKVWPYIHEHFPHVRFHLAGRDMPPAFYKADIPCLVVDGEADDAYAYMAHHGVMVVPLFSGSGIRIKIIEGMAMGKTIIATPLAAAGIGATDGENILIAQNEEDFEHCMRLCLEEPERVKQIGKKAAAFARANFDNGQLAANLLNLYQKLA
ncbi:MAG: glycosyltransferase family 4 protein [Bacteroidia bacterium]|nr:glycosyltransferase family 4 protein [Bacteroidia bacterium]